MEAAGHHPDGVSYALLLEVMMERGNVDSCTEVLQHVLAVGDERVVGEVRVSVWVCVCLCACVWVCGCV